MKTLLTLATVLLLALSLQAIGAETDASPMISDLEASAALLEAPSQLTTDPFALPSFMIGAELGHITPECNTIEGTSCPGSGGPLVRCTYYAYCEPAVCTCNNGTYSCS